MAPMYILLIFSLSVKLCKKPWEDLELVDHGRIGRVFGDAHYLGKAGRIHVDPQLREELLRAMFGKRLTA